MLALKFPALEKLVGKDVADLEPNDPRRGVCVKNGHAIIMMENAVLFFDLKDFFVKNNGITDGNSIKELDLIMDFMDGKMFAPMFWKELTSTNTIEVKNGSLHLDGIITKDVYYEEKFFEDTEIRMVCQSILNSVEKSKSKNSYYVGPLATLLSNTALKSLVKEDVIVFQTVGENTPVQFTFDNNPWIYGIIYPDATVNSKIMLFEPLRNFAEDMC